ncbi:hypothetical protein JOF48_000833 [Arthrobacter stackebrandtii]|uniref:Uncharacterized protein n=1 Tax=Arthrobacter stackebrandtii TaxID=272161 RepID=A0ABS4YTH9_9MICC|nr:hypothetical protein [Arthrobacter stackebrandtii]MBP2412034.1 hypothetical protein [Arthrobacter stackebrandtii]
MRISEQNREAIPKMTMAERNGHRASRLLFCEHFQAVLIVFQLLEAVGIEATFEVGREGFLEDLAEKSEHGNEWLDAFSWPQIGK